MKRMMSPPSSRSNTSKRCAGTTAVECGVRPSTSRTWCSTSSRAARTATSSLCCGRDRTSSWRCSDQAPTSSRPSTAKSSSMPGTSNSYVAFTLNLHTLSLISFAVNSSIFSDTRPQQWQGAQDHRQRCLRQRLEHRTATSLLRLIYARFLLSVSLSTP